MPPTDPSLPPRVNILGVGVTAINMEQALFRAEQLLCQRRKGYVCLTGVHGIMESQGDPELRLIHNQSLLCLPDGMPTVWVGRTQGRRTIGRVYGPDFMWKLCSHSVDRGYRHFLYGGNPGVVDKLQHCLEQGIAGIQICGRYTPSFSALTVAEEEEIIAAVAQARPDIIWVGLSTPKQERFMSHMIGRLDTCLMVGVGAAFDINAGLLADAPSWMKHCGLQWLHRLGTEPRRLWKRYLNNNPRFLWNLALQFAGMKSFELNTVTSTRR